MMMPTMNGFETIGMIRTLAPSLEQSKIIVFSNLSGEEDRERAMSLGADGYLLKAETTPSDAVAYVKKVLEGTGHRNCVCPSCGFHFQS